MIIDGNDLPNDSRVDCDLCILGGGVAGIVIANELKDTFGDIVILESGGEEYTPEAQELNAPASVPELHPDPSYARLRFLGGSSNHWENNTSPFSPIDFEKRDWIPDSGWPIEYSDVQPFYSRAAFYCGTQEDGYNIDYWRPRLNGQDILQGSDLLVSQIAKFSYPPVRFFHDHGKSLTDSQHIRIFKNSNLVDLKFESASRKVKSVEASSNNGGRFTVNARLFVMCLGGIENARMLLIFNDKYEKKLGNQGDSVGRYHMEHPTPRASHLITQEIDTFSFYEGNDLGSRWVSSYMSLTEQALVRHQTTNLRIPLVPATNYTLSDGIASYHVLGDSFKSGEIPENFGTHIYNFLGDIDEIAEAVSRKKLDKKLFDSASEIGGFEIPAMMEQTPSRDNRIVLGESRDRLGLKQVEIDWRLSEADKDRVWTSLQILANELGALGLGRVKLRKAHASRLWSDQLGFSQHHMGSTRMSEDPESGVVDKHQRVFGTDNFFVSGSSVFTTGSHVPPTLTIVALSIRLARHLEQEYGNE